MKKLLLLLISIYLIGCSQPAPEYHKISGPAFGTSYNINYYGLDESLIRSGVDSVINVVNQSVSTYIPDSDISKINAGDSTVVIDRIFKDVFELSARIHGESQGYFDPTVGVLRNAYGFGSEQPLSNLDSTVVDSLKQYVGFNKVTLKEDGTISKMYPQIYFDFNAVAKGYGLDQIAAFMDQQGISDYIIELGGEVVASGMHLNNQRDWTVGIETVDTTNENPQIEQIVKLKNKAMAASGNYRKFRVDTVTGIKYVHTINPLTGRAEQSDVTSATVFASTCAEADAYATTFMAMGIERSIELLETLDTIDAYLTYETADGTAVYTTPGFEALKTE